MSAHPVCDAIEKDGHICQTSTGEKDKAKTLPQSDWRCKKDGQPWPCSAIRAARRLNAEQSQKRALRPMLNTPDRLTGAMR